MADSDRQSSKQPPWHQAQDLEQVSFGTWLRHQREARSIELREIADHTKISIRYLEALEKDRFEVLPAPVFTKGFLAQYGRYIGLDPDQVVNTYLNALQGGDPNRTEEESRRRSAASGSSLAWLTAAVVLAGLLLVGYWTFWRGREGGERDAEPPPMAAPAPAQVDDTVEPDIQAVEEVATVAPLVVTLDFVDDGWVETVVDGESQLSEQVGKGESRRILAQEEVVLSLGNVSGVRAEVNGMSFTLPAPVEGESVTEVTIDLATASRLANEDRP